MKKINLLFVVMALIFLTSSCFLFRPTHERCPAYGSNELNDIHPDNEKLNTQIKQI
jgi:hypothetical protein